MKAALYIITGILLFVSCSTKYENKNQAPENEKIVTRLFEHFNKHEWENVAGLYADSADFKDPTLGIEIVKQTRQQVAAKYKELNGFLPDLNARIINLYPSGTNNIIVEFISTGTSPEGIRIELPICTIFTIENGKITKDYTYYDNAV
jgi:ketosteroid isomerase-like protein